MGEGILWVTAGTSLALGLFVFTRNRRNPMNRAWLRLCIATVVWLLAAGILRHRPSAPWDLISARIGQTGLSLIPLFFLQFIFGLLDLQSRYALLLRWQERLAGLFAFLSLTPLILSGVRSEPSLRMYPVAGPFYGLFVLWFFSLFLVCLWILLREHRSRVGYQRNQLRYVILASVFGLVSFLSMIPLALRIPVPTAGEGLLIFYALIA